MIPALPGTSREMRRILDPLIAMAATTPAANRYRKHFPVAAHLWILILHQMTSSPSLRQTHAVLTAMPGLATAIGLPHGLSFSQLARSSSSRAPDAFEALLAALVQQRLRQPTRDPVLRRLGATVLLDSSFLRLCAGLSPWSVQGQFTPGIRVQTLLEPSTRSPRKVWLTKTAIDDHQALATMDLTPWHGTTIIADLGYYGHRQLGRMRDEGCHFLTKRHPQSTVRVTATHPVPVHDPSPAGDVVLRDETITLGSPKNKASIVLTDIRMVTGRNARGEEVAFLTDRTDLTAMEILQAYRHRWQIELFFRVLKHQLSLTKPIGTSEAAVYLSVLAAMISAVLCAMSDGSRPSGFSRITWKAMHGLHLLCSFARSG
jgi:hypothetical protein